MAKVIKVFREIEHDMKRYNVGDDYPESDAKRVNYLVKAGYLQQPENPPVKPKRGKKGAGADGDSDA